MRRATDGGESMQTEKSPLTPVEPAPRQFPEERPLKGPFAYARDASINIVRQRIGRCGIVMAFVMVAIMVGIVIVILVAVPTTACTDDAADLTNALCTPTFSEYRLIDAIYGRLSRQAAEGYLTSWPTSLATRYMADSAMWHGPQSNATITHPISYPVLASLVANEHLPDGSSGWCTFHLQVADGRLGGSVTPSTQRGSLDELLLSHNITHTNCARVHVLAAASVPNCVTSRLALEESQLHVRTARYELCTRGFATEVRLGAPPDQTLAVLSRSRAGLSLDADVDALAANLRVRARRR